MGVAVGNGDDVVNVRLGPEAEVVQNRQFIPTVNSNSSFFSPHITSV